MNTDQLEINKRTLEGHGFNNPIALLEAIMDNVKGAAVRLKAVALEKIGDCIETLVSIIPDGVVPES